MQNTTNRMPLYAKNILGRMIRFNSEDNHGLIKRNDTQEVIYIHKNEIIKNSEMEIPLSSVNNKEDGRIF